MPSRNVIRLDAADAYYHVYARGTNKQKIFVSDTDYYYFIMLLGRYLSIKSAVSKQGFIYPNYNQRVELLAYCLMDNHFHLLIYQKDAGVLPKLMSSIMTSYSRYFNLKYKRTGSLFESRYKSAQINDQGYLEHISRYIHLNPRYWKRYPYSSLQYYYQDQYPQWLQPQKIITLFKGVAEYVKFLEDYEDHKQMLRKIKRELADR